MCRHLNFRLTELADAGEYADFRNGTAEKTFGFVDKETLEPTPNGNYYFLCEDCGEGSFYNRETMHSAPEVYQRAYRSFVDLPY